MDEIKVKITQDLIDMADQRDPGNCAIAMALRLASDHNDIQNVRVEGGKISFSIRSEDKRYTFASTRAESFTRKFDISKRDFEVNGRTFTIRPFTLTLRESDAAEIRPRRHIPALARRRPYRAPASSTRILRPLMP